MVNGRYRSQEKKNGKSNFEFGFFSSLAAVINSGESWRCIRWCDRGSTLLITSPILFERDVLQNKHQELLPNVKDFPSFVDALVKMGFEKVLSERLSKVQKFRHPCFKKDEEIPRRADEKRAELKRKMQIEGNCQKRSTPVEKEKLTRRVAQSLNSNNDSARRAANRKRNAEYSQYNQSWQASTENAQNGHRRGGNRCPGTAEFVNACSFVVELYCCRACGRSKPARSFKVLCCTTTKKCSRTRIWRSFTGTFQVTLLETFQASNLNLISSAMWS